MDQKIELCRLYANTSKSGKPYFVGYLGRAKVLLLKDERTAEGQPNWVMFLTPKAEKAAAAPKTAAPQDAPTELPANGWSDVPF